VIWDNYEVTGLCQEDYTILISMYRPPVRAELVGSRACLWCRRV